MTPDLQNLLADCYRNTEIFCKVFFPQLFSLPFSEGHRQIFRALDDPRKQQVVIKAPRGLGKTSIVNFAYTAKSLLFQESSYIVPVSHSGTKAIEQSENLKYEFSNNELIAKLFGELKSSSWSKEEWITETGIKVLPRGAGQQIRGLNHRGKRPSRIIVDDLEEKQAVRNETLRRDLKRWFFSDLMNSVDRQADWKVVVIGTPLHTDALLENLCADTDWHKVELDMCDDNCVSNYPDFMPTERLLKIRESCRRMDVLEEFYLDYRCKVILGKDACFTQSMFKYYEEQDLDKNKNIENVILVDPAKTTESHSAYSAVVCVGVDTRVNALYVREVLCDKIHPDQLYKEIFSMADRFRARVVGVEVTSLNEFITYPLRNEMLRSGKFFELVELKARGKKESRIQALIPFYRQGLIYHNKTCCQALESQLLSYPRSAYWDAMDALAYIVELLDMGDRYFEASDEVSEDEYKELEHDDEPELVGWRAF